MKTQLIPLESHDDLISVRDRMSWAKTPRILLVWPKSERIDLRPLDLKVLQRHAASLGAQLGLVTRHRNIRREAASLGIPVFISTGEAQRVQWPEVIVSERTYRPPRKDLRERLNEVRHKEGEWRSLYPVRFGSFALGVLAVLAIVSLFVPRARVVLKPETEVQSVSLPVQADPTADSVSITGVLPLRQLQVTVAGEQQVLASGNLAVPEAHAEGKVTFRNLTENPLRIPVGTVLISTGLPGVRFETTEPAQLPAGINERVDVAIRAESAGADGNVQAETIQAIEGNLGLSAAVNNQEDTSGGKDRLAQAPTEADREQLREALVNELEIKAVELMESRQGEGDEILFETIEVTRVMKEVFDPPEGQPGRNLSLRLEVEFSVAYIAGEDLSELATNVLGTSIPDGFVLADTPLEFEPQGTYRRNQAGVISWTLRASRRIEKHIDQGQVLDMLRGRRNTDVEKELLRSLPLRSDPQIELCPAWWPVLPLIPFNYSIEIG
jgi:hypothetical protein